MMLSLALVVLKYKSAVLGPVLRSEGLVFGPCLEPSVLVNITDINYIMHITNTIQSVQKIKEKGKEEYLYSSFIQRLVSQRSDIDHTVLPANYTMPAFPS